MLNAKFLQPKAKSRADYHLIQIRIQFHLNQEVKFISRNTALKQLFQQYRFIKVTVLLYDLDENYPYYSSRNLCICVIDQFEKHDVLLLFYFTILISIK